MLIVELYSNWVFDIKELSLGVIMLLKLFLKSLYNLVIHNEICMVEMIYLEFAAK